MVDKLFVKAVSWWSDGLESYLALQKRTGCHFNRDMKTFIDEGVHGN